MDKNKTQQRQPVRIVEAINTSLEQAAKSQGPALGIPSGFPSLDRLTRGWGKGDLIVIGGRPGTGTTALALGMARNAAVDFGVPTAFFSLESTVLEMTDRLIVSESGIPMEKLEGFERMEKEDWIHADASLKKLARAQLFLDDTPGLSPSDISERVRQLVKRRLVRAVFIDNLQAMIPDGKEDSPREARSEMLRSLKEIATTFSVPVIVLTNVGRPKKARRIRPTVTDLDEYCPLSTDYADRIFLMDRPGLLRFDRGEEDLIGLELVRNKRGRTGFADLVFDVDHFGISELQENVKA